MVRESEGLFRKAPFHDVQMINGRLISQAMRYMSRFTALWWLNASVQTSLRHFFQAHERITGVGGLDLSS
jgi:hypothetical protein